MNVRTIGAPLSKDDLEIKKPLWLKLSVIIVVLLLLALGMNTIITSLLFSQDVRLTAENNNFVINQQMAKSVSGTLDDIISNTLFRISALPSSDRDRDAYMNIFFRLNKEVIAVVIPGEVGFVNRQFLELNRTDESLINKEILKHEDNINRAHFGEIIFENATSIFGYPVLAIFSPMISGNNTVAVVFYSSQDLTEMLGSGINQSFVMDYSGNVIIHPDMRSLGDDSALNWHYMMDPQLDRLQTLYTGANGIEYFTAYQKIPRLSLAVFTQIPRDVVYEGVRSTTRRNSYMSLVILFAAVFFAWRFSRGISKPLRLLANNAKRIETGDFAIDNLSVKDKDEVGLLTKSFIEMTNGLKSARDELERLNAGLEETVKERTADLSRQTEIAFAASKSKSTFLAQMSHEIRTPMNAIIGMSEIMRTDNFDEKQIKYFKDIRTMSRALLNIINDILDISKIESGKLGLVPIHYSLHDLFDNICTISRFAASGKQLELNYIKAEGLPDIVYGDDIRVRQIFTNIVNNAIKYTPKGSVTFTLSHGKKNDNDKEDYIIAEVKDTGIGIKEENMGKLFGSYQQFDAEKNRGIIGTGLGLTITKQLLDIMNGTVEVASVYGQGTTFTIYIPLVKGNAAFVKRAGDASHFVTARDGANINILVTDDSEINLTVALGFLEKHKIKADTALGGMIALEKIRQKDYDLVFMDHMMPDIDGIETTHRIRAQGKTVPIIALSANAVGDARDNFLSAGMNDFITKPIEADALNEVLAKFLPKEKIEIGKYKDQAPSTPSPAPSEPVKHIDEEQEAQNAQEAQDNQDNQDDDKVYSQLKKIPGLNVEAGLVNTANDKNIYYKALKQFCRLLDERTTELTRACKDEDWSNYSITAHAFKGITTTLGHEKLGEMAKELEMAGKAAAVSLGDSNYTDLCGYENAEAGAEICRKKTDSLCKALNDFKDALLQTGICEDSEKTPVDIDILRQIMLLLKKSCSDFSGAAALRCADELEKVTYSETVDAQLLNIINSVKDVEYETALKQIDILLGAIK
ncbi:MAG: hypothetical protein Ta2F_01160 [Termitinemataceae bacterium]|nr:MAG: hypothetical protein Ta2F_01160 [Termitinemataceae bacterium]